VLVGEAAVAVGGKAEIRSFGFVVMVLGMVEVHCYLHSSNLRFRHPIPLMAVLAVGRRKMAVVGIVDLRPGVEVVVMRDVGRKCWGVVVRGWGMAVTVVGTALEALRMTAVVLRLFCRIEGRVTGSHPHNSVVVAVAHKHLVELHFLRSSSRPCH
jgi:hypothetical protein